jgi:hypothetical protein
MEEDVVYYGRIKVKVKDADPGKIKACRSKYTVVDEKGNKIEVS